MAVTVTASGDTFATYTEVTITWRDGAGDDVTIVYLFDLDLRGISPIGANAATVLSNILTQLDVATNAYAFKTRIKSIGIFDAAGMKNAAVVDALSDKVSVQGELVFTRPNPVSPYRTFTLTVPVPAPVQLLTNNSNVAVALTKSSTQKGKQQINDGTGATNTIALEGNLATHLLQRWTAGDGVLYGGFSSSQPEGIEATLPAIIGAG